MYFQVTGEYLWMEGVIRLYLIVTEKGMANERSYFIEKREITVPYYVCIYIYILITAWWLTVMLAIITHKEEIDLFKYTNKVLKY